MSKLRKMFSVVLVVTIIFSSNTILNAAPVENSDMISIQKYEMDMKEVYAKYGIQWRVVDDSEACPITRKLYLSELERARREGEEYQKRLKEQNAEALMNDIIAEQELFNWNAKESDAIVMGLMPIDGYYYYTKNYKNDIGSCQIKAKVHAVYNADYDEFISYDNVKIYKAGGVNCDRWEDEGSSVKILGSKLKLTIDGIAFYIYTIPNVGIKVETSDDWYSTFYWRINDINNMELEG